MLACPTSGLEFDSRTLQLLDVDNDGSIRAPEIIDATKGVDWLIGELRRMTRHELKKQGIG